MTLTQWIVYVILPVAVALVGFILSGLFQGGVRRRRQEELARQGAESTAGMKPPSAYNAAAE